VRPLEAVLEPAQSLTPALPASSAADAQLLVWKVEAEHGKVPDTNETRNDPRRIQAREVRPSSVDEIAHSEDRR
jgi:hypothetical protein